MLTREQRTEVDMYSAFSNTKRSSLEEESLLASLDHSKSDAFHPLGFSDAVQMPSTASSFLRLSYW